MISQGESNWTPVTNWAPIAGDWTFAEHVARYEGPAGLPPTVKFGLALSGEQFRDGVMRARIWFDDGQASQKLPREGDEAGGVVLGYQSGSGSQLAIGSAGYLIVGLGASGLAYTIWEFMTGTGWILRHGAGSRQNLNYNRDYQLEVTQKGQRISLMVDQVPVIEHVLPSPLPGNQVGLFAMSKSPCLFQGFQVQRRPPTAFVAMQFGEPYDTIYRAVIRPKTQKLGFDVVRIDEVNQPGIIFQDIQRKIEDAKVVIAEITAPNQNVYYEVGYARALNKPTILLAQRGKDLPFDIRSYRVVFYDDSIGGKPAVEKTLGQHLQAILKEL